MQAGCQAALCQGGIGVLWSQVLEVGVQRSPQQRLRPVGGRQRDERARQQSARGHNSLAIFAQSRDLNRQAPPQQALGLPQHALIQSQVTLPHYNTR